MPIAETIRFFGVGPAGLGIQDIKLLGLVLDTIKAREVLDGMKSVHSGNIREIVMRAYNDKKLADQVENDYLLKESNLRAGT